MKHLSPLAIFISTAFFAAQNVHAQTLCDSMDSIFSQHSPVLLAENTENTDLDNDGLSETASLRLIEYVACEGPDDDLKDATLTAFDFNLAVFDAETGAADAVSYRLLIAAIMLIGSDIQTQLNTAFGDVFTGSYAVVQCTGLDCTPDPVALGQIEVFSFVSRATNEPYTGTGDLDLDGTNNATEFNNIDTQNGFMTDFVNAATDSTLDGSETLSNRSLCTSMDAIFDQLTQVQLSYFGNDTDLANDGLIDKASLSLVEAVVCEGPDNDLKDATLTAFAANLAVFDEEPDVADFADYRPLIAAMMLIGADTQTVLNAAFGDMMTGTYEVVQCSGADCTPDSVALGQTEFSSLVVRAANEPYSGTGDLDNDGVTNATEAANVKAQNGFTSDFVIAATSPELDGSEPLRNPGFNGGGGGGGCFIATAAYGTPMAKQINLLRNYRDSQLLTNPVGAAFVDSYYRLSPPIADIIAAHPVLKSAVRVALTPVIWIIQMPWLLAGIVVIMASLKIKLRKNQCRA